MHILYVVLFCAFNVEPEILQRFASSLVFQRRSNRLLIFGGADLLFPEGVYESEAGITY